MNVEEPLLYETLAQGRTPTPPTGTSTPSDSEREEEAASSRRVGAMSAGSSTSRKPVTF